MSLPRLPRFSDRENLERSVNSFGSQSFRDQADLDYIAARLACRYEMYPQFLWASLQAIEKYLKAALLYNRIPAKRVRHDIKAALSLAKGLPMPIELSERSQKFIAHVAEHGEYRYLDVPYHVAGHVLVDLNLAVWEIRRYCQVLTDPAPGMSSLYQKGVAEARESIERSAKEPRHQFRLPGGYLEEILSKPKHPSRPALLWHNPVFGVRRRKTVRSKWHMRAQNPHLYLYPEMLDEVLKYVFIPDPLEQAWRGHLAEIKADPSKRP